MKTIRILSFIGLLIGIVSLPFWYVVPFIFIYSFFFTPYELLILAVCIDAEFGNGETLSGYSYTLTVALAFVLTSFSKPYLRFYTS